MATQALPAWACVPPVRAGLGGAGTPFRVQQARPSPLRGTRAPPAPAQRNERRERAAAARFSSTGTVASHEMQASVMLWP